jgi:hypothetical protein
MTDFEKFMDQVLEPLTPGLLASDMVNMEDKLTGNLTPWQEHIIQVMQQAILTGKSVYIVRPRYEGKSIAQMVLDVQREMGKERPVIIPQPSKHLIDELMKLDRERIGYIDRFRFVSSPLVLDDVQPEAEAKAKNGMKASRKTQAAKAKLPFYHKNRRF